MIKEVNPKDVLNFIIKYFPNYKISLDPFEKVYAYFDGDIIGFISFSSIYERCEINYIAVRDDYRRKGIAQKLLDFCLNNNFESVSLEVRADNSAAINFYLKNGFEKVSTRDKYYGDVDAIMMVKKVI